MDGPPPPEEDFSVIPISDRLVHKNWKARVSAYESLIKKFQTTASDTDPAFKPYIQNPDLLRKIVTDSNAVAQEKGVECVVAFVKFAGETAARTREAVVPALVDKCLGSARAGTKNQAIELILQYVEVQNGGAGVVADILPGLGAKQPKTVSACVTALKEIIRCFGTQATPPAPVLKALVKIFSHSDKTVRAEGTLLAQALYCYIGAAIEPWLAELKPLQVKELKESFEALDAEGKGRRSIKPERITREHAREAEAHGESGTEGAASAEPEDVTPPDPRDFAEPVDIVPKIPSGLSAALVSSKWKDRKAALDDLLTVLTSTPRIKEAPEFGEVSKSLAVRIQSDANINCVMTAAGCMEALAKGLRGGFARYREMVVPPMLERLKERKATVTDAIGAALDAVFMTITLPDILPDIIPALSSKNPQVREGALKFLGRCLSTATTPVPPGQLKSLTEPLGVLLEDGVEAARVEAATCLGTLMKMVGERPLNALMESLADVRKVKVKEAYDKATVKCKVGVSAPPRGPPAARSGDLPLKKAPAGKAPHGPSNVDEDSLSKKPAAKPAPRVLTKKAPASNAVPSSSSSLSVSKKAMPSGSAPSKPSKGAAPAVPGVLDTFKSKYSAEEADVLALELIPGPIMTDFGDANWKTRLAALDEMSAWLDGVNADVDAEVIVRAIAKKGWSEKNFQVSAKIYSILANLAAQCPSFGRSCIVLCVAHLVEKLADAKLKKPAGDALIAFAEKTSLQFVFGQAYDPISKQKAPKAVADAIAWMDVALTEFGIAGLSLRPLMEFLKAALKNANAAVRTSATKMLVTLKLFAGSGIKDLLEDLDPRLLATIVGEFSKVDGVPAPTPSRTSTDVAKLPTSSSGKAVAGGNPVEDLFPRVDIDSLLVGTTILADAKSEAWKTKKDALETLQALLEQGSNKRLKPNMGEIGQVLKARVTDTNKAVQSLALDIVSRIAVGMGKPFEKQTRFFVVPVATVLADQKAPIRAAALQTLTSIATACDSLESMIHDLTTSLKTTNPVQKSTLLQFIVSWFNDHPPSPTLDISNWASPLVASLDDRNGDVRKGAQALLPFLIASAGFDYVMQQTNSLKPASRASAVPLIQAARPVASALASAQPSRPVAKPIVVSNPVTTEIPPPPSPTVPTSKLTGIRRKLPQGIISRPESRAETLVDANPSRMPVKTAATGLRRPGAPSSQTGPASLSQGTSAQLPFSTISAEPKKARLNKDAQRWINEAGPTRKDLAEALQHQMEPHVSKNLISLLFSHDHNAVNDHITGLTIICDFFSGAESGHNTYGASPQDMTATCLANFDLPLKYASIKAHEPQTNLNSKCLDMVEAVLSFLRSVDCQITDAEALCFIPTMIYKLGDAREATRNRVQQIIQNLPKVYAYSRLFQMLLDYGLKSKVAKTRQGGLDEMAGLLKRSGLGACDPNKAFPMIASMIADKDSLVRKAALNALSEGYMLVGEKLWSLVGNLQPKEKTQLEEKLRRVPGPSDPSTVERSQQPQVPRLTSAMPRLASPSRPGGIPRSGSPTITGAEKTGQPASPPRPLGPASPAVIANARSQSPSGQILTSVTPEITVPPSPTGIGRPKSMLPSRLSRPRAAIPQLTSVGPARDDQSTTVPYRPVAVQSRPESRPRVDEFTAGTDMNKTDASDDITVTISSILSSDPVRSVDALKQIQKILSIGPEAGPSSPQYCELAEHTEGLIETITLQMAHVFDRHEDFTSNGNFRLAKHLIQTLNNFCDHSLLAESLTVDILTALLEELTLRLLETDDSDIKEVKDLSRFINMIILRLFNTGRRMSIFRALFALLLKIVKPFPSNGTLPESKESKMAELVLKCIWKLARNIPQDLADQKLDAVELFPAIEHFLQSVPPNEWRARATNKVPCGDMPLRTIKVIIQHVVAHYVDEVYDILSASFDDPSATIVYPYVYRILNSATKPSSEVPPVRRNDANDAIVSSTRPFSDISSRSSRPISPYGTTSSIISHLQSVPSRRTSSVSLNGRNTSPIPGDDSDPDARLLTIIGHISSETSGALHKEGITELHQFLKAYPHKRQRVEKMLESTGPTFRKYINRALASRAAEDEDRDVAVADTLSKLEAKSPSTMVEAHSSRRRPINVVNTEARLDNIYQYKSGPAPGRTTPTATFPPTRF